MTAQYTRQQFNNLQDIFDFFNVHLFEGKLPNCLINLSRKSKAHGFFAPNHWFSDKKKVHEISINPESMDREYKLVLSTLVHEMVHLWQYEFGKMSAGYHNKEWAEKMKEVGLQPVCLSGGETGKNCTHEIMKNGPYITVFNKIPKKILYKVLPLNPIAKAKKKIPGKNKIKYTCENCGTNVWGKDGLYIICGECDEQFLKVE